MSKVPTYYLGKTGQPAWDAIEEFELNYNLGCAWKYMVRAGKKTEDPCPDLKKAIHCLERELELAEVANAETATTRFGSVTAVVDAETPRDECAPCTRCGSYGHALAACQLLGELTSIPPHTHNGKPF